MHVYNVQECRHGNTLRKSHYLLKNLPDDKVRLIMDNDFFIWLDGDTQAAEIIFRLHDYEQNQKSLRLKQYWNPYRGEISTIRQIEKDSTVLDWNCAICDEPIKSKIGVTKVENFVCKGCRDSYNNRRKYIDNRIIKSSQKFFKYVKKAYRKEQKELLKYIKKSIQG